MTTATISASTTTTAQLRAGDCVPADAFAAIRRQMMLEFCKWDTQVGDISTLAEFPIILSRSAWDELAATSKALARETMALESRVIERRDFWPALGLPARLRKLFRNSPSQSITPAAARIMRFDFHQTSEGWQVSEVNADVPGGYAEASHFSRMIADQFDHAEMCGDPQAAYADAIERVVTEGEVSRTVALLVAPGFMEDHQVVAGLASALQSRGIDAVVAGPKQLKWQDGCAILGGRLAAIVRFYQGEWLSALPERIGWQNVFAGGRTPVANPGVSIFSESKRLPLMWNELGLNCPTWRRMLPETRDPREVCWQRDDSWLLKSAFCNTGDSVTIRSRMRSGAWMRRCVDVRLHPNQWIAQKRFHPTAIDTPRGQMFPCIGVYTIDGEVCGAYGRLSSDTVIAYNAVDAAVLIECSDRGDR